MLSRFLLCKIEFIRNDVGATEENIRTGTGSHLSALAPEPTRSLLFPLLSHPTEIVISNVFKHLAMVKSDIRDTTMMSGLRRGLLVL